MREMPQHIYRSQHTTTKHRDHLYTVFSPYISPEAPALPAFICRRSDPVTRLKLSMGPIRAGPYSLYPRHVRASMLPKKETKYSYNAFQITSQKPI